jgi:hypothetical protein
MFNLGSKGAFVPATLKSDKEINVVAYAVLGSDKNLSITLINKEHSFPPADATAAADADVTLYVGPGYKSGKFMALIAPAVNAKEGLTLGGNPIKDDGSFTETWTNLPSSPSGGKVHIKVPAASAMLIKLNP